MTNADYYVNVYADGELGHPWSNREDCNFTPEEQKSIRENSYIPVFGVWHVRLKEGKQGD